MSARALVETTVKLVAIRLFGPAHEKSRRVVGTVQAHLPPPDFFPATVTEYEATYGLAKLPFWTFTAPLFNVKVPDHGEYLVYTDTVADACVQAAIARFEHLLRDGCTPRAVA